MESDDSENSDGYEEAIPPTKPSTSTNLIQPKAISTPSSFLVQPILSSALTSHPSSTAKAPPPSLIPIASFTNQHRFQVQGQPNFSKLRIVQNLHNPQKSSIISHVQYQKQTSYEPADIVDDEDEEDEEEEESEESHTPVVSVKKPQDNSNKRLESSKSPLVSTSSHSITSGVKLLIHRAPANQPSSTISRNVTFQKPEELLSEEDDEDEESDDEDIQEKQESSKDSNLKSLLSAIRSNTSLTIEEVPTTKLSNQLKRHATQVEVRGNTAGRSDKVEVFSVPQQTSTSKAIIRNLNTEGPASNLSEEMAPAPAQVLVVPTPPKRGRPRRASPIISVPPTKEAVEQPDEGGRRTSRSRKPTKHFMPDISKFRGQRKREAEVKNESNESPQEPEPDAESSETEDKVMIDRNSEVSSPTPRKKGRQSTGRGRGRPRGSTLKAKLERESAAEGSSGSPEKSSKSDSNSAEGNNVTPRRPRGAYTPRGRGRGGKRITKAMKLQKAKLKKLLSKRKDSLQLFEEETRMSAAGANTELKILAGISQMTTEGEDASNSTSTSATTKLKKLSKIDIEESRPVTAETLFEYHWPADDPLAEIFFLQEQVSEYLGVKSFKRKYPDLKRRTVEMPERDFLRSHHAVSEVQCDLGLTALYSSEVLEIMFNDFPSKYEEYRIVVQERRDREYMRQKHQASSTPAVRDKGAEFMRRILNSASSWNSQLNKERQEQRSCTFDLQTNTLNIQKSKMRILPPHATKIGYYPVAVLPGQYTDGYKKYSPSELKYLPLNTVFYGPIVENRFETHKSDDSSDSDGSSSSEDSSSSSDSDDNSGTDGEGERGGRSKVPNSTRFTSVVGETTGVGHRITNGETITCKTCNGDLNKNKDGQFEVLIQCTKCSIPNHPTCLELSLDMLPFIKKYNWQCSDCKNCVECHDPADEDKMLFCDLCDRGYHIYCVGLRKVPQGRWHCRVCSVCYSCGAKKPGIDDKGSDWHHEFKKGEKGAKFYLHSLCVTCHRLNKKGQFCIICNKSYVKIDEKTLVECRSCEKWIHKDCVKRPLHSMFGFTCDPCDAANRAKAKFNA